MSTEARTQTETFLADEIRDAQIMKLWTHTDIKSCSLADTNVFVIVFHFPFVPGKQSNL